MKISLLVFTLFFINPLLKATDFPEFSGYPSSASSIKLVGEIKIDTENLFWKIKDRIEYGALGKPANFSGKYYFLQFGCGSQCIGFRLIDVDSGTLIKPNIKPSSWSGFCFKNNSSLLIVNPMSKDEKNEFEELYDGEIPDSYKTIAYSWNSIEFVKVSESSDVYFESCNEV